MILKIVSDGTASGTNLYADEERIERIRRLTWEIEAGSGDRLAKAHVELDAVVELDGLVRDGSFVISEGLPILPDDAMQAARDKADDWNACDPPTHITPDAVRQIIEAFVGAIVKRKEGHDGG